MNNDCDFRNYADNMEQFGVLTYIPSSLPGKIATHLISQEKMMKTRLELRFEDIDFTSKRVLDIGAGKGLFSVYAAHRGADRVVALEPEIEGSSEGMIETLERVSDCYSNIEIKEVTFQDYVANNDSFDVIISNNSINHLDEKACVDLHKSMTARKKYHEMFDKLDSVSNTGCSLIIADGARRNFWGDLGIKSPFINLEWNKHQSPKLWISMLQQHGFEKQELIWNTYFSQLGKAGKRIFCNYPLSYLTYSKFILKLKKQEVGPK